MKIVKSNEMSWIEKKHLSEALQSHPKIKISNRLGGGNRGEAYLLENGNVLKVTYDDKEYTTAMILKNRKLKHIVDIYDGWSFEYIDTEGYSHVLFAIIEEYVDVNSQIDTVQKFVALFKHAWFSIYFSDIEPKQRATFDDLDEYMRHPQKYPNAVDFTKRYILTEGENYNLKDKFENIYNQLTHAYLELYQNAPNSHLDLNDGNIGFTPNGILKVFDMQ